MEKLGRGGHRTPWASREAITDALAKLRLPRRSRSRPTRRRWWLALALVAVLSAILAGTVLAAGATFTVTSTGDGADSAPGDGVCETAAAGTDCTLRAAIQEANHSNNAGLDTIAFNIAGAGVKTISPDTPLPVIDDAVTIDGYTQGDGTADDATANTLATGNNAHLLIELNGFNAAVTPDPANRFPPPPVGLWFTVGSAGSTVRGLVINRFEHEGVRITEANSVVEGNFIGTDASGSLPRGNFRDGVLITQSGNTLGGSTPAARNVISANGGSSTVGGVSIIKSGITVQGNYIGTDKDGTSPLGNTAHGVLLQDGGGNTIGGTTEGARNVISANNGPGVLMLTPDGNQVRGNYIGTKANGTGRLGNSSDGVIVGGLGNTIGGTTEGARNIISANGARGVHIVFSANNEVQGNYIGTDKDGTLPLGNSSDGVFIEAANGNTVGGTTAAARNVISDNGSAGGGSGVFIQGSRVEETDDDLGRDNHVQGNYIGTDKDGTLPLGNKFRGVAVANAPSNTIGGTAEGAGNVISANNISGIFIGNSANRVGSSTDNKVQGNYVGVDKDGTRSAGAPDLGNSGPGVDVDGGSASTIGGTAAGARNVISSNQGIGVVLSSGANQVQGNYVGTDKTGTRPAGAPDLGNTSTGVHVNSSGASNTIGGPTTAARNVIADNGGNGIGIGGSNNQVRGNQVGIDAAGTADLGNAFDGVAVNGTGNAILSNSIFSNGGASADNLGIDLSPDGVTPNDPDDPDFGANNLQNFPVLGPFTSSGGATTIKGTLNSTPDTTFTVQFFSSPQADPSGHGEGKTFLGEKTDVTTDSNGDASFSATTPEVPASSVVTGTATDPSGNTSELSRAQVANNAPTVALMGPSTATEGESKTYDFTVDDPDPGDSFTPKSGFPDCGSGGRLVAGSLTTTASGGSFQCSFADGPANPEVRVQVTDAGGADSNVAAQGVTVANASPTIDDVTADPSATNEGSSSTIKVDANDTGDDTLAYEFDCNGDLDYDDAGVDVGPQGRNAATCAFPDSGAFTVNIRVTDGDGGEATGSTTVDVNNVAPTVTLDGPAAADEGDTKTYTYTVTDPGDDTQTTTTGCGAKGQKVAGSDTYDQAGGNGSFQCRFPDGPATSDVTVRATDSDGASDADDRRVTVTVANVAPQAEDLSAQTNEDESKAITLKASDPGEDDSLTYSVVEGPSHGALSGTGANLTYTPAKDYNGPDSFTYRANDGSRDSNTATVWITIAPVNDAPTISDITNKRINQNTDTGEIPFTVGDAETPGRSLTVTGRSRNTTLVPSSGIRVSPPRPTDGRRTVRVTPARGRTGSATIVVTVKDAHSRTRSDTFVLTVRDTTAPTITRFSPRAIKGRPRPPSTTNVTATFSERMREASVEAKGTVTLVKKDGNGKIHPVAATVDYEPLTRTVTLDPAGNLESRPAGDSSSCYITQTSGRPTISRCTRISERFVYTATVTTAAKDIAGNALAKRKVWSFTVRR